MKRKSIAKRLLTALVSTAVMTASLPFAAAVTSSAASDQNYSEALELSLYFYDANQCGSGVDGNGLTWRGDCHTYDSKASLNSAQGLSGSSSSAIKSQNGGSDTVDVSGGYHDAGDHIKFSMTMGFSCTSLAWSYFTYPQAYQKTGSEAHLKYILKNFCDYFMKVTYLDSNSDVIAFCYQVASEGEDHSVWSSPEVQTMNRTTYWADASHPSADAAGEMASALASSSLAFKNSDPTYAAKCLKYAKALQKFAAQHPQKTDDGVGSMYSSSSQKDDIAWSELWCALAEGGGKLPSSYTPTYKITGNACYNGSDYDGYIYSWDKVWSGYAALLAEVGYDKSTYINEVKYELNNQGGLTTSKYNAAGWGASRYNCGLQMMALHLADLTGDVSTAEGAKYQMNYILGDNPLNMSFLIGYGKAWPTRIHHRAANPGTGDANANTSAKYTAYGTLIGGPDSNGTYNDSQNAYQFTEPALDYNGCFALAISGLCARYGGDTTTAKTVLANAPEIKKNFSYGSSSSSTTEPTTSQQTAAKYGDVNEDGGVDISDVVKVRRYLINQNKYPLSEQAAKNADVQSPGSGISAQDAVAIQQYILGTLTSLPC